MHPLRAPRAVRTVAAVVAVVAIAGCTPTTTTATVGSADGSVALAPGWNGAAVEGTPTMPAHTFTGGDGRPYDLRAAMLERPTLLYFGYTNCPDICPVHLANIAAALGQSSVRADQVNVVLITVDPARDSPDVLGEFTAGFDPSFVGLWASEEEVADVMADLGLPTPVIEDGEDRAAGNTDEDAAGRHEKPDAVGHGEYTVGHPTQVFAFDTTGRARIAYPFGTRQSQWVEDLPRIVREEWS